ncbi:hypothetical protein GE061_000559 [Apolygus lucorum]|uniref:Tesmin/TSO1-like CXC domain-containing protein n=1 Tax=Apolygus lucorum TaxID=248454 RepID=A0A8S9Y663_APOLU|nr:hypothetical protein GE061_000559 [Apolygus lucorum]
MYLSTQVHLESRTPAYANEDEVPFAPEITVAIPPSEAGTHQNCLKGVFQNQQWLGNELDPVDWSRELTKNGLVPITTLQLTASEKLLQLINCMCGKGCQARSGCKRAALLSKKHCQGCEGLCCKTDCACNSDDEGVDDDKFKSRGTG